MRVEHSYPSIAQTPEVSPDGTDNLWIDLQPVASAFASSSSSTADAPNGMNSPRADTATASAVSFGFIAIGILVSMFLVIAIFERILRPRRQLGPLLQHHHLHPHHDLDDLEFSAMTRRPLRWGSSTAPKPPNVSSYGKGVSVVMPGNELPTFIAHPAPFETKPAAAEKSEG